MFKRQTEGSVVCPSCRRLVGVNDETCYNCGRANPGLWGYAKVLQVIGADLGFTQFVLYLSILVYLLAIVYGGGPQGTLFAPSFNGNLAFGSSGAIPVFVLGRWWTVLSASFLHGGILHIFFNLYWARMLIPAVSSAYGASKAVIIFTAASVVGFGMSSVAGLYIHGVPFISGASYSVGASAAIFGLLGALVRRGGGLASQAKFYALILGVFGLIFPMVDNWAHAGGFAGGYLAAAVLNHLKPETPAHLMTALGCMAAFVLSILVSFLTSPI